jgi:hypothetical protein
MVAFAMKEKVKSINGVVIAHIFCKRTEAIFPILANSVKGEKSVRAVPEAVIVEIHHYQYSATSYREKFPSFPTMVNCSACA